MDFYVEGIEVLTIIRRLVSKMRVLVEPVGKPVHQTPDKQRFYAQHDQRSEH